MRFVPSTWFADLWCPLGAQPPEQLSCRGSSDTGPGARLDLAAAGSFMAVDDKKLSRASKPHISFMPFPPPPS